MSFVLIVSFFQAGSSSLQAILRGEFVMLSSEQSHRPGQKERAIALLNQMIEDAHKGKRQFLSGSFPFAFLFCILHRSLNKSLLF